MNISELLVSADKLLSNAEVEHEFGNEEKAIQSLAKLRELLNKQPELEAGGA